MKLDPDTCRRIVWVSVFGVAFAFVESSVVVYLRSLYYPEGFTFPLKMMSTSHIGVELAREAATVVMLTVVGILAGTTGWQRFGYFLVVFGVWDVFYYVWLKVILDWPSALTDWDVLFLLPLPWIGPVIAPILISVLMIICGGGMVLRIQRGLHFRPTLISWLLGLAATLVAVHSFTHDVAATLHAAMPSSYPYGFLVVSLVLYAVAYATARMDYSGTRIS